MTRGLATNLHRQSENLAIAPWLSANVSLSAYGGALPTGVGAMSAMTDSNPGAGNTSHYAIQTVAGVGIGDEQIISFFAINLAGAGILALAPDGGNIFATFNGGSGSVQSASPSILGSGVIPTNVANLYRFWARFKAFTAPGGAYLQLTNGASGNYTANGQSVAIGGVMTEKCVPGQLTPSPYYASGATSGVGPRDYGENFLQQSEDQSKSPWVATRLTPTSGAALSPGGAQTATSLVPSGVNDAHYISQPVALTSYTGPTAFRARVKASGYSWCRLQLLSGASTNTAVYYNLGTGAVGTTSVGAGAVLIGTPLAIPVPGYSGWYDLFFSASSTSGWQTAYLAVTIDGAGTAFAGDGVSGILSWGTQIARTNQMSDYRKTMSGIWVPSGAPRSLAI